jgi:hypothetical protein
MSCQRCGGMIVMEEFYDEKSTWLGFEGARCLNCGHIEDPVMRANHVQPTWLGRAGRHGAYPQTIFGLGMPKSA